LDLYQVDHTKVDVIVVDEYERRPLGRPWLTLVLDVASRMIAGYYLTFDPPCSTSVALALSHAVLPKERYLQELGLQAEWPISGLPCVVHVDNADEFHARALKRGCQEHGIQLCYRPPLQPHYGGHIERLIGTLMKEMHLLPGTTFSSVKERGEYDSAARAVMSMQELEQWLALQITGAYHQSVNRHLRCSPLQAWRRLHKPDRIRHPDDPNRFYIDFLPVEQRLIRRDGIQLFRIHYWDNALSPLAGRSTRRHLIRYDPRNLSRIFVKGVVERGYLSVPYRDLAHPRITLAEQRAALRELAQAKHLSLSEDNIFQTVASQRLLVEQARKKTARARRQTQTPSTIKSKSHTPQRTESGEPGAYDSFAGQVQPYPVEIWDE
jgi:putative transposase